MQLLLLDLTLGKVVELELQSDQVKEHISAQAASGSAHLNDMAWERQQQQHKEKGKPKSGRQKMSGSVREVAKTMERMTVQLKTQRVDSAVKWGISQ